MIYLDNAASSHPKPMEVTRAVLRQLRENGANPGRSGHTMSLNAAETIYSTRKTVADHFGTQPETVIFTQNTTDAINQALKGLLHPGDHVLISDMEHNSVLRPLVALSERGVTFDTVSTEGSDEELISRLSRSLRPETKLVLFTHASNVTGQIFPIREIGAICRKRGILFGVDAAQTAGTERYDLKEDPIDFLCVPGHKGLLGPQGTGALILAHPMDLLPLTEGGTGSDSMLRKQPRNFPEGYESGTLNTPGIAGLQEGVRFVHRYGDVIREHEKALRRYFLSEVEAISGYRILGKGINNVGTIAITHETDHSESLARWLDQWGICTRGGYHCAALAHQTLRTETLGALRISFGYRNTEKDVAECVKYLKKYQNNRPRS